MGNNSGRNAGHKRKAKFGPGAEIEGVVNGKWSNYVVLDVSKSGLLKMSDVIPYYYKVYDKESKNIQFIQPYFVERLEQIGLLNIGNLRTLLDDAPFDGPDGSPSAKPSHGEV
jgi:hypothetical protein